MDGSGVDTNVTMYVAYTECSGGSLGKVITLGWDVPSLD